MLPCGVCGTGARDRLSGQIPWRYVRKKSVLLRGGRPLLCRDKQEFYLADARQVHPGEVRQWNTYGIEVGFGQVCWRVAGFEK